MDIFPKPKLCSLSCSARTLRSSVWRGSLQALPVRWRPRLHGLMRSFVRITRSWSKRAQRSPKRVVTVTFAPCQRAEPLPEERKKRRLSRDLLYAFMAIEDLITAYAHCDPVIREVSGTHQRLPVGEEDTIPADAKHLPRFGAFYRRNGTPGGGRSDLVSGSAGAGRKPVSAKHAAN
jgi:hypothetical protein